MMEIKAQQFVTSTGRQVLTDNGQQGMGGVAGIGSTTEKHQGRVAEAIFANCAELDNDQLNEIIEWVRLYQSWMPSSGCASGLFYAPCLIPALPGHSGDSVHLYKKQQKDLLTGHIRSIFETG